MSDALQPHRLYSPWKSPGQNTRVGSLSIFQWNLPNPGIEPRSPTFQADSLPAERVLYQMRKSLLPVLTDRLGLAYILQADSSPAEPQGKPKNTGVDNNNNKRLLSPLLSKINYLIKFSHWSMLLP